jgi:IS5 family transposase
MKQLSLAQQAEFQRYSKKTRREQFLDEMDVVMPWAELYALTAPHYSKDEVARKPVGLEIMLRVYFCSSGLRSLTRLSRTRSTSQP